MKTILTLLILISSQYTYSQSDTLEIPVSYRNESGTTKRDALLKFSILGDYLDLPYANSLYLNDVIPAQIIQAGTHCLNSLCFGYAYQGKRKKYIINSIGFGYENINGSILVKNKINDMYPMLAGNTKNTTYQFNFNHAKEFRNSPSLSFYVGYNLRFIYSDQKFSPDIAGLTDEYQKTQLYLFGISTGVNLNLFKRLILNISMLKDIMGFESNKYKLLGFERNGISTLISGGMQFGYGLSYKLR